MLPPTLKRNKTSTGGETTVFVFDIGTESIKAGLACHIAPKLTCLNIAGCTHRSVIKFSRRTSKQSQKPEDPVGGASFAWLRQRQEEILNKSQTDISNGGNYTSCQNVVDRRNDSFQSLLSFMRPHNGLYGKNAAVSLVYPSSHGEFVNWTIQTKVLAKVWKELVPSSPQFLEAHNTKRLSYKSLPASKYACTTTSSHSLTSAAENKNNAAHQAAECNPLQSDTYGIFFSEPVEPSLHRREKLLHWAFEVHDASVVRFAPQPLLSLTGMGHDSGLVVDVGAGLTQIAALCESSMDTVHAKCYPCGGRDVTKHLWQILRRCGNDVLYPNDADLLEAVKTELCFVSQNLEDDLRVANNTDNMAKTFTLPDGHKIAIGSERFLAPEVLLSPNLSGENSGKDIPGLGTAINDVISSLAVDTRRFYYSSIFLMGGSTMFKGFPNRLKNDIVKGHLADSQRPLTTWVDVHAHKQRQLLTFCGCSIVAQLVGAARNFEGWVTREQYAEIGAKGAAAKCNYQSVR